MKLLIVALLGVLFSIRPVGAEDGWEKFENCTFVEHVGNDGDSFHVKCGGKEYFFRLYFVDCPESNPDLKDRIVEQSGFFEINEESVMEAGKEAEKFTSSQLSSPFTVWTKWQNAKGSSQMKRHFAFVSVAGGDDLGELVVKSGWGRVYGARANHPEGPDTDRQWKVLDRAQKSAQSGNRGCWGMK